MENENTFLIEDLELDIAKSVSVIREHQKASASFLMRHLKLGYGRAAQVLERLEKLGIVGPARGSKPRTINQEKLQQFKFSSALPSEPESPRISTPPVADGNVSRDCPPEIPSADDSLRPGSIKNDALDRDALPTGSGAIEARGNALESESGFRSGDAGSTPALATNFDQSGVERHANSFERHSRGLSEQLMPVQLRPLVDSNIRLAAIAYLPPERFNTLSFLENLKRNPPAHPLITFSDTPWFGDYAPMVRMKRSIEIPSLMELPHGIANLAFFLAFGEAWKGGFTHFCYLESDCRQRNSEKAWDEILWNQFLWAGLDSATDNGINPKEMIVGGSMMLWNPFKPDEATAKRANELLDKWNLNRRGATAKERNRPIPTYRARQGTKEEGSGIGCNGAGAIYSVEGLRALYPELKDAGDNATKVGLAAGCGSFDFDIAKRIWRTHGAGAFDRVAHLPSMFSSFGEALSTEAERIEMLRNGSVVLIHQVKSAEVCA